ncbi:PAS domain-containing protein [Falsirhodobacter algicola]|uniref:PAS domain-containing protein n=1 Tax=Falsirhodobacter algicola TaxID=2692330 RepID=A0A8J8MR71_9RHOB|nr:PAS domain-containing protein [Falsirhodobacter algicola]QUS35225.1 PAS domain-containing protein [Falsirhodobacter algicola]
MKDRFPMIASIRACWQSLRAGEDLPARSQIDPVLLGTALPHAFLIERSAPGVFRFRLAGRHLTDLMGMELRGMPLTALFVPADRTRLSMLAETLFTDLTVMEMQLSVPGAPPSVAARLVLLPLRPRGGGEMALGGLQMDGTTAIAPCRFALHRHLQEPLHGLQEDAAPFQPAPRPFGPRLAWSRKED